MKFSIITPVLNGRRFIAETIESVLSQKGDFSIEYIIVDGASTDGTLDIAAGYQKLLKNKLWKKHCTSIMMKIISRPDKNMYEAINTGFSLATGDIFAYINSDDIYLPGAFQNLSRVFYWNKHIQWISGITSYTDETSAIRVFGECYLYDRNMILKGVYGRYTHFIQQDSVFWRRGLWITCGPIDTKFRLAGDFFLWRRFAETTRLYSLNAYVSCFRVVKGQLSQHIDKYMMEYNDITPNHLLLNRIYAIRNYIIRVLPKSSAGIVSRLLLGPLDLNKINIHGKELVMTHYTYYV